MSTNKNPKKVAATAKATAVLKLDKEERKNISDKKLEFVKNLMVKKLRSIDIETLYMKEFGESDKSARNYMKKVRDRFKVKPDTEEYSLELNKSIATYEDLYRLAYERGDYKECREIQKELDKKRGLEQATKIQIDSNINQTNTNKIDMSSVPDYLLNAYNAYLNNVIDITPETLQLPKSSDDDTEEDED